MLNFLNASLQTVATGLVVYGGFVIVDAKDYLGGVILLAAGLFAYFLYEKMPSK